VGGRLAAAELASGIASDGVRVCFRACLAFPSALVGLSVLVRYKGTLPTYRPQLPSLTLT
jgi:hypothetical protein